MSVYQKSCYLASRSWEHLLPQELLWFCMVAQVQSICIWIQSSIFPGIFYLGLLLTMISLKKTKVTHCCRCSKLCRGHQKSYKVLPSSLFGVFFVCVLPTLVRFPFLKDSCFSHLHIPPDSVLTTFTEPSLPPLPDHWLSTLKWTLPLSVNRVKTVMILLP